jgi:nitroreductase
VELDEAIMGRRSVRSYTRAPVDQSSIARLIEAATHAPSAMNEQPWSFTVVRDQKVLDRISAQAKVHMLERLMADPNGDRLRTHLLAPEFQIFYHAPVLIVIGATKPGSWVVEDCALAAENLMLAAYAARLGSCWIGFAQSYLQTAQGKAALGVPDSWTPAAPIIVGHPAAPAPPVPRNPPEVRWLG